MIQFVVEEKSKKIFFVMMLFSLSAVILFSYDNIDLGQKSNAFAQTTNPSTGRGTNPVPENAYADIGNGPIPEDNSTYIGNGPIPEDNSVNPPVWPGSDNLTNANLPNDTSSVDNTTSQEQTQTNTPSIPEFGPLASVILIIAISSAILFRRKFS